MNSFNMHIWSNIADWHRTLHIQSCDRQQREGGGGGGGGERERINS